MFDKFLEIMDRENKKEAVKYALDLLTRKKVSLKELYKDYLTEALYQFSCRNDDKEICVWKEHKRTSIIRTILECSYPFIDTDIDKKNSNEKRVMVFCPSEEYHEIGAIMVNHYFLLAGYNSQYIGANTPRSDVLSAIRILKPDYVAISVSNYYNLVITKKIVDDIISIYPNVKIIIGGNAFTQLGALEQIKHHIYFAQAEDILHTKELV